MINQEKINPEELAMLEAYLLETNANFLKLTILLYSISIVGLFLTVWATQSWQAGLIQFVITTLIFSIIIVILGEKSRSIRKDLKSKQKNIITDTIKKREQDENTYFFYINQSKIEIPISEYVKYNDGETISIHLSTHSQFVFKIEKNH